ncbi:glycoside hydrolase family protein [Actinophytocola sp.]|uniref:glycoside hydrolase family protein n=1 Tax=Actinophytocola sp. TaxID=1872138 RepID=UPI00389B34B2
MRWTRYLVVLLLAALVLGVPREAVAATTKKGVSALNVGGVTAALADVRASWYYDWASNTQGITAPAGVEFVPMIWGRGSVTDAELSSAKALGTTLLGFNEPDMAGQADMTVEQALDLWPRLQDTGLRLGAPAVAFGGDQPGGWLDRFMSGAAARGYRVDFIPLHWYGGDFSSAATNQLRGYLQAVHDRYHKPVWLTEYALTDFSGPVPRYPTQAQQADFVRASTAMLQGLSFVERYAWFTLSTSTSPTGLYSGSTANTAGAAYRAAG